jgi:signal transduction histidine kinase
MQFLLRHWKNVPIGKKLYAVFWVMAILVASELATLGFALHTLSALRAFVAGEGSWSKAQKNAALSLRRFESGRDPQDYADFLEYLKVPEGDRRARIELQKPNPDMNVVREGFVAGHVHPDDIEGMVGLLRRFSWVSYIQRSLTVWAEADQIMERYKELAARYKDLLESSRPSKERLLRTFQEIKEINIRLTELEDEFSFVLGEGSRRLEDVLFFLLFLAVVSVESIGLTLTFLTSRSISAGIADISLAADEIGRGNFAYRAVVDSRDEIGRMAEGINRMGGILQRSYRDLEQRVEERTSELKQAVKARDDFLSVASHELKTPLTSLKLHIQMRRKAIDKGKEFDLPNLKKMLESDEKQVNRITRLIDDMLDISRISQGRLILEKERFDLCVMARDVLDRFSLHFSEQGCALIQKLGCPATGVWDYFRAEQAFINLLTNAMKYGPGHPIEVGIHQERDFYRLWVKDEGRGIDPADHERIFRQFERAVPRTHISGLGLGLYIVQELMQAQGGKVEVESRLGEGATFSLLFPLESEKPKES